MAPYCTGGKDKCVTIKDLSPIVDYLSPGNDCAKLAKHYTDCMTENNQNSSECEHELRIASQCTSPQNDSPADFVTSNFQ